MSCIIYCNSCFETKSELKRKYFVTSCSHVFCAFCLAKDKNFCKLCNEQCRVLEINENMPPEVKIMFESGSVQKLIETIKKIRTFQENQTKFYDEKMRSKAERYPKCKQDLLKLYNVKKGYSEAVKKEKQIIDRLKVAYNTKQITPDLFILSSRTTKNDKYLPLSREGSVASYASSYLRTPSVQNNSPMMLLTPVNRTNAAPGFYSTARLSAPRPSPRLSSLVQTFTPSRSSNLQSTPNYLKAPSNSSSIISAVNTSDFRSSISSNISRANDLKMKPPAPTRNTQQGPTQFRYNVMMGTREALLKSTLRQMNAEGQMKYPQAMRQHQPKF